MSETQTVYTAKGDAVANVKYLANGQAVEVLSVFDGGFVVRELFEQSDEPDYGEGEPIVVKRVYDVAPTHLVDKQVDERLKRVAKLTDEIHVKSKALADIKAELATTEASRKVLTDRVAKDAALQRVVDFLDGKITHFVEYQYGRLRVLDKETALKVDSERDYDREPKLLTLFGTKNAGLEWRLNQYRDGSGSYTECYPCLSLEEATAKAAEVAQRVFAAENGWFKECAACCDKLGIPVPQETRDRIKAAKRKNLEEKLAEFEEKANKASRELYEFEAEEKQ